MRSAPIQFYEDSRVYKQRRKHTKYFLQGLSVIVSTNILMIKDILEQNYLTLASFDTLLFRFITTYLL